MEMNEVRIKQEAEDDWELPGLSTEGSEMLSSVDVKSEPEWTFGSREGATSPVVFGGLQPSSVDLMTSVAQDVQVTSTRTFPSTPQTLPTVVPSAIDKPLNFKLQISQDGGLRLAPPASASDTVAESDKGNTSGSQLFFVRRTADGQSQLYMAFSDKPEKLYLLQPSAGHQLNVKVTSPEKQPGKNVNSAANVGVSHSRFGTVESPIVHSRDILKRCRAVMTPQVLMVSGKDLSLLHGPGTKSLLEPSIKEKLGLSKVQCNPESDESMVKPKMPDNVKTNVPGRLSFSLPCKSESRHHRGVDPLKRKRKNTARKSFIQNKKVKPISLLRSAFLEDSLSHDSEILSANTVQESGFEDGHDLPFKIDSVFSLAHCEEQPSDFTLEEDDRGVTEEKAIKVEDFYQTHFFTQEELLDMCGSSFVVVERLDKAVIDTKGNHQVQSKCSLHCRERTLNYLCILNLIRCHYKRKRESEMEENLFGCRATQFLKKECFTDADAEDTTKKAVLNAPVTEFSAKAQPNIKRDQFSVLEDKVSTKVNTAFVSSQSEVAHVSTDVAVASTVTNKSKTDSVLKSVLCSTLQASSITTNGGPPWASTLAEPLSSSTLLTAACSSSPTTNTKFIPSAITCRSSVTSSFSASTNIPFTETPWQSSSKQENFSKEAHIVSGTESLGKQNDSASELGNKFKQQDISSDTESLMVEGGTGTQTETLHAYTIPTDTLAQAVAGAHCRSDELASSLDTTPSSVVHTIMTSGMTRSLPTKSKNQSPALSSSVMPLVLTVPPASSTTASATVTASTLSGIGTSQPLQLILKFVTASDSLSSSQTSTPAVYSVVGTETGALLSTSSGQVTSQSSAEVMTSAASKIRTKLPSSGVPHTTPITILPKQVEGATPSGQRKMLPVLPFVKIQSPTTNVIPAPSVSSGISLLTGFPGTQVAQSQSTGPFYVVLNKPGTVASDSAGKGQDRSSVVSSTLTNISPLNVSVTHAASVSVSTASVNLSTAQSAAVPLCAQLMDGNQSVQSSLLKITPSSFTPTIIKLTNKSERETAPSLARPQCQGSTVRPLSVTGSSAHQSSKTVFVKTVSPRKANRSVSAQSQVKTIILKPPYKPVPVSHQMLSGSQSIRPQIKVVHVPSSSKLVPSLKKTVDRTDMSLKSIDMSTTKASGTFSVLKTTSYSSPKYVKVVPASSLSRGNIGEGILVTCRTKSPLSSSPTAVTFGSSGSGITKTSIIPSQLSTSTYTSVFSPPATQVMSSQFSGRVSMLHSSQSSRMAVAKVAEPVPQIDGPAATIVSSITPTGKFLPITTSAYAHVMDCLSENDSLTDGRKQPFLKIYMSDAATAVSPDSPVPAVTSCSAVSTFSSFDGKAISRESVEVQILTSMPSSHVDSVSASSRNMTIMTSSASSVIMSPVEEVSKPTMKMTKSSRKKNCQKKKRTRLDEKYPLPPGVVIKSEPLTSGYPADATSVSSSDNFLEHDSASSDFMSAPMSDSPVTLLDFAKDRAVSSKESQSAALSDSLTAYTPLDLESTDPPVGFQLTDPATDSDSGDPPTDLDCPDLESSSVCEADRPVYDEPPVLTPVFPLPSLEDKTDGSRGPAHSQRKAPSSGRSRKSRACKKRQVPSRRKTSSLSLGSKTKPVCPEKDGPVETFSQRAPPFRDDNQHQRPVSPSSSTSDSDRLLSRTSLMSLYSSYSTTSSLSSETRAVSSDAASDRIRRLKERLRQQNEELDKIRQQRAMQGPLTFSDV